MDFKRIFLAVQVPKEVKNEVGKICQKIKSLGFQLRLTPRENLHITLAFLERVDSQKLPDASIVTKSVASEFSPFSLNLYGLDAFPNLKLPQVVFVTLSGEIGVLTNLARKIQKGLANFGFKADLGFVPHITIARIKSYVNKLERKRLGEIIQRWGKLPFLKIPVDSVTIFESTPTSAGHIHTILEKVSLKNAHLGN